MTPYKACFYNNAADYVRRQHGLSKTEFRLLSYVIIYENIFEGCVPLGRFFNFNLPDKSYWKPVNELTLKWRKKYFNNYRKNLEKNGWLNGFWDKKMRGHRLYTTTQKTKDMFIEIDYAVDSIYEAFCNNAIDRLKVFVPKWLT